MKIKKITKLASLVLGATLLTACSSGDSKIAFGNYWDYDSTDNNNRFIETAVYDVSFEEGSGAAELNYELDYGTGKYETSLEAKLGSGGSIEYVYKTTYTIDVTFRRDVNDEVTKTDKVITEVRFGGEGDLFKPIFSTRTVESYSPKDKGGATAEKCYYYYHYSVVTEYEKTSNKATSTLTNLDTTEETEIKPDVQNFKATGGKKSYIDNEQLILMTRAIPSGTSSAKVKIYSPYTESKQTIKYSFDKKKEASFEYNKNGTAVKESIVYLPVTLKLSSNNSGQAQTVWVAKAGEGTGANAQYNPNRNMILYMEMPLAYSMGTMVYTLSSLDYQQKA